MKRFFLIILFAFSLCSCSYEIEIGFADEFHPKVVLNSFIHPDAPIVINVSWSRSVNSSSICKNIVPNGTITLFEDGNEIDTKPISNDSIVKFDYLPIEGRNYKIVADVEHYGEVTAQTRIPKKCDISAQITKQEVVDDYDYILMRTAAIYLNIDKVEAREQMRSVWLYLSGRDTCYYENISECFTETNYDIVFCDNPYIDNFNRVEEVDATGESFYLDYRTGDPMYKKVIRLPYSSLSKYGNFQIASEFVYEQGIGYENANKPMQVLTHVRLKALSPSDDFDRYQKSCYQQSNGIYFFNFTPISFDKVRVYSNVENGLGIFAGYNQNIIDLKVNAFSEEEKEE